MNWFGHYSIKLASGQILNKLALFQRLHRCFFCCHNGSMSETPLGGNNLREFAAALRLSREKGVGAATFRRLIEEHGLPSVALLFWRKLLRSGHCPGQISSRKSATADKIEKTCRMLKAGKFHGWFYSQPGYPAQLRDLSEPPPVVFATGPIGQSRFAAVVGARLMAPETSHITERVCHRLFADKYAIVSGGAAGVDAVAHTTALDEGVYTLAVLGTGIDVIYPAANLELFAKIRGAGALMTELMPGTRPARSFFPTRNRLIAAMAETVVVIQASEKSGSMITAAWAKRLGRSLMVVVPPAASEKSDVWAGNRKLLSAGAIPLEL